MDKEVSTELSDQADTEPGVMRVTDWFIYLFKIIQFIYVMEY